MRAPAAPLEALEIASGLVLGLEADAALTKAPASTPLAGLEAGIRPALERPPCLVSFSGGRDSSAVLATATALARREGLPLPIPATNRFPHVPEADESSWQERTVKALGLHDWVRLEFDDELDCVGPVATTAMRRHGLLFPFNAHFHVPLLTAASGGSLLTGIGGDELFGTRPRATLVLTGAVSPEPRDVLRLGLALAPRVIRRGVIGRRDRTSLPWLTASAGRAVRRAWAGFAVSEPLGWGAHVRWCSRLRYLRIGLANLELLADDHNAQLVHPLVEPAFLSAFAREKMATVNRTAAMRALFGEYLPADLLTRATKSSFDGAFFGVHSRGFVAGWQGLGADPALVDVDWLRRNWCSAAPVGQTFLQLQAAWLASSHRDRLQQPLEAVREAIPAGRPAELPGG
jgi:hypothetical protein